MNSLKKHLLLFIAGFLVGFTVMIIILDNIIYETSSDNVYQVQKLPFDHADVLDNSSKYLKTLTWSDAHTGNFIHLTIANFKVWLLLAQFRGVARFVCGVGGGAQLFKLNFGPNLKVPGKRAKGDKMGGISLNQYVMTQIYSYQSFY